MQAAIREADAVMFEVKASNLVKSGMGESETNLRNVFQQACAVAQQRVAVIFIDEIDTICPRRITASTHEARVVAQLLTLLDGSIETRNAAVRYVGTCCRSDDQD